MTDLQFKPHEVSFRSAEEGDVPVILRFIRELATYEKLSHEVVATQEQLRATLFGSRPAAEVILAEVPEGPVGFALFFTTYSTFLARPGMYLEDLYVVPAARRRGIGQRLLAHLARIAMKREYGRFEWAVLDWNEQALKVYRAVGAEPMDAWTVQRMSGGALKALAQRFDDEILG